MQAWCCTPVDSGQVQLPSSPRGYYTICKIRVHLNRLNTALHLNRTHISNKRGSPNGLPLLFGRGGSPEPTQPHYGGTGIGGKAAVLPPKLACQAQGVGIFAVGEYPAVVDTTTTLRRHRNRRQSRRPAIQKGSANGGLFCLSKPQAWHIIDARSAAYIISPFGAVSHHAPACIFLRLDEIQHFVLMIYRNKLRMIYKATP